MSFVAVCLLSLAPARWRARWDDAALPWVAATRLTAALQIAGAILLFASALLAHFRVMPELTDEWSTAPGALWYLLFWFTPRGLVVLWLLVEGFVRILHAFHGEPLATLPLAVTDALMGLRRPRAKLPDRVTLDGDRLTIASARRYDWTALSTIRHADRLWRLRELRTGNAALPYVYDLEPTPPPAHLIRRVVDYPP